MVCGHGHRVSHSRQGRVKGVSFHTEPTKGLGSPRCDATFRRDLCFTSLCDLWTRSSSEHEHE
jgi:hypothetical protein